MQEVADDSYLVICLRADSSELDFVVVMVTHTRYGLPIHVRPLPALRETRRQGHLNLLIRSGPANLSKT